MRFKSILVAGFAALAMVGITATPASAHTIHYIKPTYLTSTYVLVTNPVAVSHGGTSILVGQVTVYRTLPNDDATGFIRVYFKPTGASKSVYLATQHLDRTGKFWYYGNTAELGQGSLWVWYFGRAATTHMYGTQSSISNLS